MNPDRDDLRIESNDPLGTVERLVEQTNTTASELISASASQTQTSSSVPSSATSSTIPSSPRYRFMSFIAKGGMGEVWRAFDLELNRVVAIKILKERTERGWRSFVQEARLVASLEHPAIIPIHDLGKLDDGRPFFVMKLITSDNNANGAESPPPTLHQLIGSGTPIPVKDRPRFIQYCQQVCEAVAYAHSRTPPLLHRDIKPSNIMVGTFGEILVMDWGIAKELGESTVEIDETTPPAPVGFQEEQPKATKSLGATRSMPPQASTPAINGNHTVNASFVVSDSTPGLGKLPTLFRLDESLDFDPKPPSASLSEQTATGDAKGTIAYMPPEQARGQKHLLCPATDVFSLGGLLVAAITGRPTYQDPNFSEVFRKACEGDLQETFARLSYSGTDPELIEVIRKALAPQPEDRYANAGELAKAIGEYRARVEQRLIDAENKRRRQRVQLSLLAGLGALTAVGVLVTCLVREQFRLEGAKVIEAQKTADDAEKNRRLQESHAKLRKATELVTSRRGDWTKDALALVADLREFASDCTEEERQIISGVIAQCMTGIGFEEAETLEKHRKLSFAEFSSDGKWLALADRFTPPMNLKLTLTLHEGSTGQRVEAIQINKASPLNKLGNVFQNGLDVKLIEHPDSITGLAFDSESKWFACCTKYGSLYWRRIADSGAKLKSLAFPLDSKPESVRFLDPGKILVSLNGINQAVVIDVESGMELSRFQKESHDQAVYDSREKQLVSLNGQRLRWIAPGDQAVSYESAINAKDRPTYLATDRSILVAGSGKISMIDAGEHSLSRTFREAYSDVAHSKLGRMQLAVDPGGRFLVSTIRDESEGKVWDVASGQTLATISPKRGISHIAIHPEGDRFVVTSEEGAIVYRSGRDRENLTIPAGAREILAFHVSTDGKRVFTAQNSPSNKIRLREFNRESKLENPFRPELEIAWNPAQYDGNFSLVGDSLLMGVASEDGFRWFSHAKASNVSQITQRKNNFMALGPAGELWMGGGDMVHARLPAQAPTPYQIRYDFLTGRRTISALAVDSKHALFAMTSGHIWIFPVDRMEKPKALELKSLEEIVALRSLGNGVWLAGLQGGTAIRFQLDSSGSELGERTKWRPHDADIAGFAMISREHIVTGGKDNTLALWKMRDDNSPPAMLFRWKTTNPVRQIEYDPVGNRLYWLNEHEYGLHDLDVVRLQKRLADFGVGNW